MGDKKHPNVLYPKLSDNDELEGEESFRSTTDGYNSVDDGGTHSDDSEDVSKTRASRAQRRKNVPKETDNYQQNLINRSRSSNRSNNSGASDNESANAFSWLFNNIIPIISSLGFISLLIMVILLFANDPNIVPREKIDGNEFFAEQLKLLRTRYKSQDKLLWSTIRASVKSVLNSTNPISPSVILLLSSGVAMGTSHDFAKNLANITAISFHLKYPEKSEDYERFYSGEIMTWKSEKAKERIDNFLNNAYQEKHVALLFDVDKLPGDSAIMLHAYCDNTNAPYKNVVLYLTLTCESEIIENSGNDWSEIGDICMKNILLSKKGLNEDKIGALLSRIGNSAVVVVKEENFRQ